MFDEYVDKWFDIKRNNKGTAKGQNAKLMLNYLVGQFARDIERTKLIPELDPEEEKTVYDFPPEQKDKDGNILPEIVEPVYLPVAIFVNAYARVELLRLAYSFQDRYIYSDTDSLHIAGLDMPKSLKGRIHQEDLGFLKIESEFEKAYYIKEKAYAHIQYGKTFEVEEERWEVKPCRKSEADARIKAITCSGLPEKVKEEITFRQFRRGLRIDSGKPQGVYVKGGVILEDSHFQIK